jgi:hypothetical protein
MSLRIAVTVRDAVDGEQDIPQIHERDSPMISRLRTLGIVLGLIGLGFVAAGGYSFYKVHEGSASL